MECSNNGLHNCDQICIELEGNFQCACNDGYELAEDNATCSGMYIRFYDVCVVMLS